MPKNNPPIFQSVIDGQVLKIWSGIDSLNHQLTVYEVETIVKEAKLKALVIWWRINEVL